MRRARTTRDLGISFVAYAPLGRGLLTADIADPATLAEGDTRKRQPRYAGDNLAHNRALAQKVEAIAKRKGCTPAQLALAWVLAQGDDVIPIPGTKQKKRLLENIGALDVKLSDSRGRGDLRTRCRLALRRARAIRKRRWRASTSRPAPHASGQPS